MADTRQITRDIKQELDVSWGVATELALLSNDADLAIEASYQSSGLNECKARIVNERFKQLES